MSRLFRILSVSAVIVLVSCGGKTSGTEVRSSNGKTVGQIEVTGSKTGTIENTKGDERGKVRGTMVRDADGKHIGTVNEKEGHVVILNANDNPVGSLEKGTDCYGKGKDMVGQVSAGIDSSVAAGACLIFFLQ